ncbi:MAG: M20/M25/M40 family metallo-hydrolase [Anaerolineae bacterium]|nr:M20/M25/M40 family metallo-hydrolase [Anaerolineae bacterium]
MSLPLDKIRAGAQTQHEALVAFTQQIIRIPSLPGQEGEVAMAISAEMRRLGFDEVWTDQAGNVIGKIKGGTGPTILLNGHMDHVDPGPVEGWSYAPFSGQIVDEELWGRASVDMKGPVAAMIYAASLFKQIDLTPPGDVLMTVPVMEEVGGLGTLHLAAQLQAEAAICGEPSGNTLRRGHRGRVGLTITFEGRSAHASVPHLGLNPHYGAAAFLNQLPTLSMAQDVALGPSTVVPTLYTTDQISPNVIPGKVILSLDWRNVPTESPEAIVTKLQQLVDKALKTTKSETGSALVEIVTTEFITYTGLKKILPSIFPSFILAEDNPFIKASQAVLTAVLGQEQNVDIWRFATDGGHLMAAGIPTIGFGPGDETLAHTNQERLNLSQLKAAVPAYAALTLTLAEAAANV